MKTTSNDERRAVAEAIPDLGCGGRTVAELLETLAGEAGKDATIVEIAPWLGSATGFLALGMASGSTLHAFDAWHIDETWQAKARKYHGIDFELGEDILPVWKRNVGPLFKGKRIDFKAHKGDILAAEWDGSPIHLFVDDISNTDEFITSTMRIFGPSIVKGAYLVFMDYQFPQCGAQRQYLEDHGDEFEFVRLGPAGSKAAVFRKL
jgi:hypothetical protein